jgi:ABC-2 type transport system ATP-binding protein
VLGRVPWDERRRLAFSIGAVFGQRSQLWYHLPPADSFALLGDVYERDREVHRRRLDQLVEAFGVRSLLHKPVRQLSLGERMWCELVASLLHAPELLLLDESTIGLDVTAKAVIRDLVREQSEREGRTVLLTSHDTGDMERVCDRVIVIHRGHLLLDRPLGLLRREYLGQKRVTLRTSEERVPLQLPGVRRIAEEPHQLTLEVDVSVTPIEAVVQAALKQTRLHDLLVEDPPMDQIVKLIYERAEAQAS